MKYALAIQGKKAERRFRIPLGIDPDGNPIHLETCLVPVAADEEGVALEFANRYAKEKGIASPKYGDPLFDLAYQASVIAICARDPDVGVPGSRPPSFASSDEVLGALHRETLAYVYAAADDWCDQCSPLRRKMSDNDLLAGVKLLAKEGDDGDRFFDACGPALRRALVRFMARQLVTLLEPSSPSIGSTETSGTKATTGSPPVSSPSHGSSSTRSKSRAARGKSRNRRK
jgi:hypothetical protein